MIKRLSVSTIIFLSIIFISCAMMVAAFTPYANPPQCDGNLTPDNSNCIIGANMGAGMLFMLGFVILVIAGFSWLVLIAIKKINGKYSKRLSK